MKGRVHASSANATRQRWERKAQRSPTDKQSNLQGATTTGTGGNKGESGPTHLLLLLLLLRFRRGLGREGHGAADVERRLNLGCAPRRPERQVQGPAITYVLGGARAQSCVAAKQVQGAADQADAVRCPACGEASEWRACGRKPVIQ